jgi:hypothetical protein
MRTYNVHQLLNVARWFAENPDGEIKIGYGEYLNREQWRRWFSACLMNKINASDPRFPVGRKAQQEYQTDLMRMRAYIGNRIIIDWIAPSLGQRVKSAFADRMRDPSDY